MQWSKGEIEDRRFSFAERSESKDFSSFTERSEAQEGSLMVLGELKQ